jgi:hypothetical protein
VIVGSCELSIDWLSPGGHALAELLKPRLQGSPPPRSWLDAGFRTIGFARLFIEPSSVTSDGDQPPVGRTRFDADTIAGTDLLDVPPDPTVPNQTVLTRILT